MSLDGYIADKDGGYDWIIEETDIDFGAYTEKIDALLMGRHTYELIRDQGEEFGLKDMEMFVVSTTLDPAEHPDVTMVARGVERFVADLKGREGKDIWLFGGGVLFRSLLEAGLVNRVEVAVIPVLLGEGIPLLPGLRGTARLSLHSTEAWSTSGIVLLKYDVERAS
jgi:dihydrofolate reductase